MSYTAKIILPLIDDNMKQEYISEKYNFVDLYTSDINKPYMDDCVFLMYKTGEKNEYLSLYNVFKEFPTFFNWRIICINNEYFCLYIFKLNREQYRSIKNGILFDDNEKNTYLKLIRFWVNDDEFIKKFLKNNLVFKFERKDIPEEDYREEI